MSSVEVPISHVPTRLADVSPDRQRLSHDLATFKAPLRCKTRRYFDDSRPSFFRFEREYVDESRPARVGDGAGEIAVLEHVLDPEIFDSDEGVALYILPSRLVGVVLTLACDLEMLLGCLLGRFPAAVGTLLPSGALALRSPQSLGCSLETAGVLDNLAFGV